MVKPASKLFSFAVLNILSSSRSQAWYSNAFFFFPLGGKRKVNKYNYSIQWKAEQNFRRQNLIMKYLEGGFLLLLEIMELTMCRSNMQIVLSVWVSWKCNSTRILDLNCWQWSLSAVFCDFGRWFIFREVLDLNWVEVNLFALESWRVLAYIWWSNLIISRVENNYLWGIFPCFLPLCLPSLTLWSSVQPSVSQSYCVTWILSTLTIRNVHFT